MGIYGHRHLGFLFRPLFEVTDLGVHVGRTQYNWTDIQRAEVRASLLDPMRWFSPATYPWAYIYFNDGKRIWVNGRALAKRGEKGHVGFLSSKSAAFEEVIDTLRSHGVAITPTAGAIAFQFGKLVAIAALCIVIIFGILWLADGTP
jgi:hypothetical protein